MQIIEDTKGLHDSFEDILNFGKELFCEGLGEECDIDIIDALWPSSWEEAQIILCRAGYENPKEHYVCFCQKKAKEKNLVERNISIMENGISWMEKNKLANTVEERAIKYYY